MDTGNLTAGQLALYSTLRTRLGELGPLAVAFSGGTDSAFLLKTAHDVLGSRCVAVTSVSVFVPGRDLEEAKRFCREEGIRHILCETDILAQEGVAANPPDRCYLCKKALFGAMKSLAASLGIPHLAEGSNTDDTGDYRPGRKAIRELGLLSPLLDCGLGKADIRALSRALGLPSWDKPASACLASRIPYGEMIDPKILASIDLAEQYLAELGFRNARVRAHGSLARIELLPDDIPRLMGDGLRASVGSRLKALGFTYIACDLSGYRMGSLNEALPSPGPATVR